MVSFELTDDQREIRDWVHGFAEREMRPVAAHYDETEEFPWEVVRKAAEMGLYSADFLAQTFQDETGITPALVSEELTWGCAGIALAIQGTGLPVSAIVNQGTPEQIATWIPACYGTAKEPVVGAFCATEADAGSDVSAYKTRALKSNGVATRLYVAPREPHQWQELRHQIEKANIEMAWFEKYALGKEYVPEIAPAP